MGKKKIEKRAGVDATFAKSPPPIVGTVSTCHSPPFDNLSSSSFPTSPDDNPTPNLTSPDGALHAARSTDEYDNETLTTVNLQSNFKHESGISATGPIENSSNISNEQAVDGVPARGGGSPSTIKLESADILGAGGVSLILEPLHEDPDDRNR